MITRRLSLAFIASVCLLVGACDLTNTDGVTGQWVGTATFTADTIMANENVRFIADYTTAFQFDIIDDDGLISGLVRATFSGSRIVQEAGYAPDTLYYDDVPVFSNALFGTYVGDVLEMDVPNGPYEENLWTFDVRGRNADLDRELIHQHEIPLQTDSSSFTFDLKSDDLFEMRLETE